MKLRQRWAAGLAAFLMVLSLTAAPGTGRAWFVDGPMDTPVNEGDPSEPGGSMPSLLQRAIVWIGRIRVYKIGQSFIITIAPVDTGQASSTRSSSARR